MSDIRKKAEQDRNWLERLLHKVPGFRGYLEKEERRETDKILRDHLAGRIGRVRSRLDPVMRDLTDGGGLMLVNEVDRIKKALDKAMARLAHASYGYAGLFDVVKVREAELDRLYEFDAGLVERVDQLEQLVTDIEKDAQGDASGLKDRVRSGLDLIREFNEHFDQRERLFTESSTP